MKKILLTIFLCVFLATTVYGFLYQVNILDKEEIKALKDDELLDIYVDAMIERKATEAFYKNAGFTPKEYNSLKQLLGLIIRIRQEMLKRQIEPPPIEEWLR